MKLFFFGGGGGGGVGSGGSWCRLTEDVNGENMIMMSLFSNSLVCFF